MHNLFARFYTNAMFIVFMVTFASILLSIVAPPELAKASFIGATSLSTGLLTLGMAFIARQKATGNDWVTPINLNVWLCIVCALCALAAVFNYQDVKVFLDSVFENVVAGTSSGSMALAMAFARKDGEREE